MRLDISIHVDAPPDRVWSVMSDVERWHEWTPSVTSIKLFDKPLRIGSRALIRQPRFPPAMWKVIALGEREFKWRTGAPGMWVVGQHGVVPEGNGSRATLSLVFSGWMGPFWGRLTRGISERYIKLEAEGLKRRAESA